MVKIEDYLFSDKELDKAKRYCLCNHYNKNGKGLYCFKHKKQTPDKIAEVTNEGNKRD